MEKELFNYLKKDYDFKNCYLEALKKEINQTKSIVSDIIFQVLDWQFEKSWTKQYHLFLKSFITRLFFEINQDTNKPLFDYYIMDEKIIRTTIGTSWVKIKNTYINLDDLYIDFKSDCNN